MLKLTHSCLLSLIHYQFFTAATEPPAAFPCPCDRPASESKHSDEVCLFSKLYIFVFFFCFGCYSSIRLVFAAFLSLLPGCFHCPMHWSHASFGERPNEPRAPYVINLTLRLRPLPPDSQPQLIRLPSLWNSTRLLVPFKKMNDHPPPASLALSQPTVQQH